MLWRRALRALLALALFASPAGATSPAIDLLLAQKPAVVAPTNCANNSYGWSGVQTNTTFTVPANCSLMAGAAWGGGGTGVTGTLAQGGNGGGSGGFVQAGTPGVQTDGMAVTAGTTLYVNIGASTTCISTGSSCTGTIFIEANAASGNTGGSNTGAQCDSTLCNELAGANGGVAGTASFGAGGGAAAPGSLGVAKAGGVSTAADYGGGGAGGSNGASATTPAAATTTGHAGGSGGGASGGGTGGSTGTHAGGNGTAGTGGGGGGGYGSAGNTSGAGGTGALYNGAFETTASAAGTVASSTYLDGGGGGGGSGGAAASDAVAAGGAGGGCGGGGGGSGANPTTLGTNGGGGAGAAGCIYVAFTGALSGSITLASYTAPSCYDSTSYISSFTQANFTGGLSVGVGTNLLAISNNTTTYPSAVTLNGKTATLAVEIEDSSDATIALYTVQSTTSSSSATASFTITGGTNGVCVATELITNNKSSVPICSGSCPTAASDGVVQPFALGSSLSVSAGQLGIFAIAEASVGTAGLPATWAASSGASPTGDIAIGTTTNASLQLLGMSHVTSSSTPTFACGGTTCSYAAWGFVGANFQ